MSEPSATTPDWSATIAALRLRLERAFDAALAALRPRPAVAQGARALAARPAGGGWSTLEVGDHLVLANHFLLILLRKLRDKGRARHAAGQPLPLRPPAFEVLEALGSSGLHWEHPPHMSPRPEIELESVRARLAEQRAECLELLDSAPAGEGALHRIRMSVLGQERLDLYQYAMVIALHLERHVEQMRGNDR